MFIALLFTMLSFFSDNHSILMWQPYLRFHVNHSHSPSAIVCAHHFRYRRVNVYMYSHTLVHTHGCMLVFRQILWQTPWILCEFTSPTITQRTTSSIVECVCVRVCANAALCMCINLIGVVDVLILSWKMVNNACTHGVLFRGLLQTCVSEY